MYSIIVGTLLLSLLHAFIPSHWLPVLAIGRKEKWSLREVSLVTFLSGLAHALSTILIGMLLGRLGQTLAVNLSYFTHFIAPALLVTVGVFFIYQHHRHKHFHLHNNPQPSLSKRKIITALLIGMFLSPCMEIEAYFLLAGAEGWWAVLLIAGIYLVISVSGMLVWVNLAYRGLLKINAHTLEHKSGIITGWTLVVTGIISFFIF
ncbi:MAG: hypothetical protein JWQ27_2700 [Ferruginibacter sp.]|nr:hypothetical protein [Ferruginibacter sp.]